MFHQQGWTTTQTQKIIICCVCWILNFTLLGHGSEERGAAVMKPLGSTKIEIIAALSHCTSTWLTSVTGSSNTISQINSRFLFLVQNKQKTHTALREMAFRKEQCAGVVRTKGRHSSWRKKKKSWVVTTRLLQCKHSRRNKLKFCPDLARLILFVTLGDDTSVLCHQTYRSVTDTFCSDWLPRKIIIVLRKRELWKNSTYPTFFPSAAKGLSTKENIKTAEESEV